MTQIRSKRKESEEESEPLVEESSPILGIDPTVDNDKGIAEPEKETSGRERPAFGYRCYRAGRNSFIWTALFLAMILPCGGKTNRIVPAVFGEKDCQDSEGYHGDVERYTK